MMFFSTYEIASIMQIPMRKAHRLGDYLNFDKHIEKNRLVYSFDYTHPFVLSLIAIRDSKIAKPIYSLSELAQLWKWSRGNYSKERVKQLLVKFAIPIHNKERKGWVYLSDLKKMMNI